MSIGSFSFEGRTYPVELVDFPMKGKQPCKRVRYHGAMYGKVNTKNGITYWRCVHWLKGCRARIPTRPIDGRMITTKANNEIKHINHADR